MAATLRRRAISETLWHVTTRTGSFGTLLGLVLPRDGGKLKLKHLDASTSEWTLPWPAWACRADGALSLGTALAIADEISTYGGMAVWDEWHRPGVTTTISGVLRNQSSRGNKGPSSSSSYSPPLVEAGEELSFVTRKLKAGRQLGFLELEVWRGSPALSGDANGSSGAELLAVGRHTKMLSVPGWPMNVIEYGGHPLLYPLVQPLVMRAYGKTPVKPWPPFEPPRREDVFPPLGYGASSSRAAPSTDTDDRGGGGASSTSSSSSLFEAALQPCWANALGTLHGGAGCMLAEQIAAAAFVGGEQDCSGGGAPVRSLVVADDAPPARVLSVTLLSSLVCDGRPGVFEAVRDPAVPNAALATLRHKRSGSGDGGGGGVAVEAQVAW